MFAYQDFYLPESHGIDDVDHSDCNKTKYLRYMINKFGEEYIKSFHDNCFLKDILYIDKLIKEM